MRRIFRPAADECVPEAAAVLAARGMPETPDEKTAVLLDEGFELFRKLAAPAGVVEDVPAGEFGLIYAGEGRNAPVSPLATVYAQADRLALFCVTVGPAVSDDIARRFDSHDYALGYVLDAVASAGAERLADLTQEQWNARRPGPEAGIALRYSPGYCGWDVTGQRRLFERLRPEEVGVTLRESCLMEPLKSISGVLVSGPAGIHRFSNDFPFCSECAAPTCRERIAALESART